MGHERGLILAVDDDPLSLKFLSLYLHKEGYQVETAPSGPIALARLREQPVDLVLLDMLMPEMDGLQVLTQIKDDPALQHLPVLIISTVDQMERIIECIEAGATDYLIKPYNLALLRARLNASMAQKRLRDVAQAHLQDIEAERQRADQLLLNILPAPVAEQLKHNRGVIAQSFEEVTVLFADLVDFTVLATQLPPARVVTLLDEVFATFDSLAAYYNLEKIKTIGDAYMAAGGLPVPRPDHAEAAADMALDMKTTIAQLGQKWNMPLRLRIGLHCGPVMAGVIGRYKFSYDLWGDTVNTASRMEAYGAPDNIQVSANFWRKIRAQYNCQEQGEVWIKGKGAMQTYLLLGKK